MPLDHSGGRKHVTVQEAEHKTNRQSSAGFTYGLVSDCPVYHFDTGVPTETITRVLAKRVNPA